MTADETLTETARLNIARAREALARARPDQAAAAIRNPRPADLSRLRADEQRRETIAAHAGRFRESLREGLGLAEFAGPYTPVAMTGAGASMDAALCDHEICAPPAPPLSAYGRGEADAPAAPPAPEVPPLPPRPDAGAEAKIDAGVEAASAASRREARPEPQLNEAGPEPIESWLSGEPDPASRTRPEPPKKRRKLFGLF